MLYLQSWKSCAVTTLGRGGSDLTATTIGKALGLLEIQVIDDLLCMNWNSLCMYVPVLSFMYQYTEYITRFCRAEIFYSLGLNNTKIIFTTCTFLVHYRGIHTDTLCLLIS